MATADSLPGCEFRASRDIAADPRATGHILRSDRIADGVVALRRAQIRRRRRRKAIRARREGDGRRQHNRGWRKSPRQQSSEFSLHWRFDLTLERVEMERHRGGNMANEARHIDC
jgi:hypothetical protein